MRNSIEHQQQEGKNAFYDRRCKPSLNYFGQADLEGILSDHSADVVMFTPDKTLRGPDAIRPLFQALIAEFRKPGASFDMKVQSVDGDYAYIVWSADCGKQLSLATDIFVVRNDKIVTQSFTSKIGPKNYR